MNTIAIADVIEMARAGRPLYVACGDAGVEGWLAVTEAGPVGFPVCLIRPHIGPGRPVQPLDITLVTGPRGWLLVV